MAARFINIDRQTPLLLPPDLRDWVAEDDLVHFVIEAVERLPLSTFAINHRGSGDAQFPPAMMLALLIYSYANGVFGSRRIERATHRDVAVRYLCADTHPDHDTICTFRRNNLEAVAAAFVDVLELARALRLLKLGCVSLDGTHIRASASKDQNVTYQRGSPIHRPPLFPSASSAGELRTQLRLDMDALLAQAEASDREDTDPQALPKEIARREKLLGKMDTACAQLEARAQARAAAEQAEYEHKVAARAAREGSAKGPAPQPPRATPEPDEQINLSDPDARLMRKSQREGYTQSDNAQASVDADGTQLILGQRVSTCAADVGETAADLAAIPPSLGAPTAALADCGYADKATIERLGHDRPGLDLYSSVHREDAHAERRYDWRPLDKIKAPKTLTDPVLLAMAEKLRTPEGKARYRRRACTVEPVFGIIPSAGSGPCGKSALGFRQFLLRGLQKVSGEWNLVCLAYNLKRLHTLRQTDLAA